MYKIISSVLLQSETGGEGSTAESSSNGVWQGEAHYIFTNFASAKQIAFASQEVTSRRARMSKVVLYCQQILPGVRVIIVNPETRGPLGDSHLGEVGSHE